MSAQGVSPEHRFVSRGRRGAVAHAAEIRDYRVGDFVEGEDMQGHSHTGQVVEINDAGPVIETDQEKWK